MNVLSPKVDNLELASETSVADNSTPYVIALPDGVRRLCLLAENVHCAVCIRKIEDALHATPGVLRARVNLSTRRVTVEWNSGAVGPAALMAIVEKLGFPVAPFDAEAAGGGDARTEKKLLMALAVAGFAAANIMLLSVSVWSGHDGGMGVATRDMFHWISALIAIPAIAYAGRPFFASAVTALRSRQLNMDVPISLAVLLAAGMSLQQTASSGEHAYFDASVGLLFFLLIGRYLDHRARAQARSAATHLIGLAAVTAEAIMPDGSRRRLPVNDLCPGMTVAVAAGDRFPVDGDIAHGTTTVDTSLITGESLPTSVTAGTRVFAGTLNLSAPVQLTVSATGEATLLAEIVRLMEAAEQGRARYVRLADRVARFYAPAVHILSAAAFIGWLVIGVGWESALLTAVAVLIITCPCALALAVPAVQVVASGELLRHGVLLKSADGLERLAAIDTVVFDKTGTLTEGRPRLMNADAIGADDLAVAVAMSRQSRHPFCQALSDAAPSSMVREATDVVEVHGCGISGRVGGESVRLGNAAWLAVPDTEHSDTSSEFWLRRDNRKPVRFRFEDTLRSDAAATIATLHDMGMDIHILSGDRSATVAAVARKLGICSFAAACMPADKVARVRALTKDGRKVLMVGDGLNDAPALAAGHASMSPASAADISRTAADIIYQGGSLMSVTDTIRVARQANRLVRQNFGLTFLYNIVAVPLAIAGFATPLFAAIAMSSSSLIVTGNALRLRLLRWRSVP